MIENRQIPVISAIVPCYNQTEELRDCLLALSRQDFEHPYEVILVDSASDPQVLRIARSFPHVQLLRSPERLMCGPAKNLGAENARADYLAFTDCDCRPESEWLKQAYQALQSGRQIVGGPVLDALPWNPIAVTDNLLQFADVPPGRPAGRIAHVPGCNLAVQKSLFIRAGTFYGGIGEDVRFSGKLNQIHPDGIYFVPELRVAHTGRRTWRNFLIHQWHFGYIRGIDRLLISEKQQILGKMLVMVPFVIAKRLFYIFKLAICWDKKSLIKKTLLLPLILAGLTAWAAGFRRGCIENSQFEITEEDPHEE
jgi:glycosyltransferase involved in cell wall biosynthesis